MKSRCSITLTDQDRKIISEAIRSAETQTSGEIVPMIVSASDHYSGARWRFAAGFAFLGSSLTLWYFPHLWTVLLLALQIPFFGVGLFLASFSCVLRIALNRKEIDEEVHQRAIQSFFENSLHHTRDRSGVLIFISILERKIEVLADSGIHARAPKGFWDDVVRDLGHAIRVGNVAQGIVTAVSHCGELLMKHFPRKAGDANELPNHILVEK